MYGGVTLGRVRPLRLYRWQAGESAQLLYAESVTDLLDTGGLGLLRCRFGKPAHADQPADAMLSDTCRGCDPASCACTEAEFLNRTLLRCPVPNLETIGPVEVSVTVDGGASYSTPQAGLPVRVQIMDIAADSALNVTARYETSDERVFISLADPSWLANSLVQVRVAGVTRHARVSGTAPPAVAAELPRGLKPGAYAVSASADGGATFKPPAAGPAMLLEIVPCAGGSSCSQGEESLCPEGRFCPQGGSLAPIGCPLGSYQGAEGATRCQACPAGSLCPSLGMPEPRACPPGFLCGEEAAGTLSQLEPCPAGYFCALGRLPEPCPDGSWCPEGTATALPAAGNYSSPQPCRDGVVCGPPGSPAGGAAASSVGADRGVVTASYDPAVASAAASPVSPAVVSVPATSSGARSPTGGSDCPAGHYCRGGRATVCPAGSYCATGGLAETRACPPG